MPFTLKLLTGFLLFSLATASSGADWRIISPTPEHATIETISEGLPVGVSGGVRLNVLKQTEPYYMVAVMQMGDFDLKLADIATLTFWARSKTSSRITAVVEDAELPYNGVCSTVVTLTSEWKQYSATGPSLKKPKGTWAIRFQAGYKPGVVEIAGVSVRVTGQDPALANVAEALTDKKIQERIEKHRKADLTVLVTDSTGKPVPNARVQIQQTKHAFLFGSNIFILDVANTEPWQLEYRRRFLQVFNYATLPFYWGSFESVKGEPDYTKLDSMMLWCLQAGLTVKGHPLVWHEVYPDWAPKNAANTKPLLKKRVTEIVRRYQDTINIWDVVNEANAAPGKDNGVGDWAKTAGKAEMVAEALTWARKADPDAVLIYNDFDMSQANLDLITALKEKNSLPDVIGMQSHMHQGVWPDEILWKNLEAFAAFGKPLHFTEVTIVSGQEGAIGAPPKPWKTTPEGEKKQAEAVRRFYTLLFSHPSVEAITWWDFADKHAWLGAPAGFLREDMTPKPAYAELFDLIKKQWWTDASATTNLQGEARLRGFKGQYQVRISIPGKPEDIQKVDLTADRKITVQVK